MASKSIADLQMEQLLLGGSVIDSPAIVESDSAGEVPLIVKGFAGQTANLQEWQNSAGTVLANIGSDGSFRGNYLQHPTSVGAYIDLSAGNGVVVVGRSNVAFIPLKVKGMAGQTGSLQQWQDSTGTILATLANSGALFVPNISDLTDGGPRFLFSATAITVANRNTIGNVPLIVKGMASQTGDLQQWQDSAASILARVTAAGQGRFASLGVGNSLAATVSVGALARKIEVFDAAGASLGFVPVYASIT